MLIPDPFTPPTPYDLVFYFFICNPKRDFEGKIRNLLSCRFHFLGQLLLMSGSILQPNELKIWKAYKPLKTAGNRACNTVNPKGA